MARARDPAGRLRGGARGRRPAARALGAARLRQAGAARLVGRDLEGLVRGASSTPRSRQAFEHDPLAIVERSRDGMEVECSVLGHARPDRLASRARSWSHGRLVRLRGQVRAGRHGAGGAGARCRTRRASEVRALAVEVFKLRRLRGHGPRRLLRRGRRRACSSTS